MVRETKSNAKMGTNIDQRRVLLDSIRGTTVTIPNLRPIFQKYIGELNPNYAALVPVVNSRLERYVLFVLCFDFVKGLCWGMRS